MKKHILFLLILLPFFGFAQSKKYEKLWNEVESFELKKLPKSALKEVDIIYKKAKRTNNTAQQVKCFMYQSKFALLLEENAQFTIIENLKKTIATSKAPTKQLLHSILAELYTQYYNKNSWKFRKRTKTDTIISADFRTWDLENIYLEIVKNYQKSLENTTLLQRSNISAYSAFISIGNISKYQPTLYDFLAHRALYFYKNSNINLAKSNKTFALENNAFIAPTSEFIAHTITSEAEFSKDYQSIKLYQDLERFHYTTNNLDALLYLVSDRLLYVNNKSNIISYENYQETLYQLIAKYKNQESVAFLQYDLASTYYKSASLYYKKDKTTHKHKNDYNKAFDIASQTVLEHPRSIGAYQCQNLIAKINHPSLSVQIEKNTPINKPSYSKVSYKNIDTLHLNIYKLTEKQYNSLFKDWDWFYYQTDSTKITYIKTFELTKSWQEELPQEHDFRAYSTEIIIPALENGRYLLINSTKPLTATSKIDFEYTAFQVTDITFVKSADKENQVIQVLDRNTGKPIPNAAISFELSNYRKTIPINIGTNGDGYAYYKNPTGFYGSGKDIEISTKTDKAYFGNINNEYHYKKERYQNNNLYLFTDRAIYRPGQKVFFKGILTKTVDLKSTVLPNKKATITLRNANNEKVKTLELETNAFGSFFGEFQLPADGLNGTFYIEAKVKSLLRKKNTYATTNIQVEEYKRPKFEANFNPITATFKVNDTIKIKGTATAFSGAKITDAKVVYRVKREVQYPRWYCWYFPEYSNSSSQEITQGETTSDAVGEFTIPFKAIPDDSVNKDGLPVFSYTVTADITDINGETHSTETTVRVGYHTMTASVNATDLDKDKTDNTISISTQNLNYNFVPASGTVKIYKVQAPDYVLRKRPWQAPTLPQLSETEFKKLFPNDPYTDEDNETTWQDDDLVFQADFETKDEALDFALGNMTTWQSGKYHIYITTKDKLGNPIKAEEWFNISSVNDKTVADHQMFTIELDKNSYKPYETATLRFGSAAKDFWLTVWVEKQDYLSKMSYHLTNEIKTINIPITEADRGGFSIHYYWANSNTSGNGTIAVQVPYKPHKLNIITKTFRDKLQPGQKETWEFIIKGNKGEQVSAELLANMYDASLDDIISGKSYWMNPLYRPQYNWNRRFDFNTCFGTSTNSFWFKTNSSPMPRLKPNTINWYGFSFNNNYYTRRKYENYLKTKELRLKLTGRIMVVTGTVSDDMGPLPSATVMVKGATIGTTTDFDGHYQINAQKGDILVFSYAGMTSVEKTVNFTTIDAILGTNQLEEVVVTGTAMGYIPNRKTNYASAVMNSDIRTALSGKVAGVQIEGNGNGKVYLRGALSKTGSSEALYIVDGVETSANEVNMNDVISISVLKGADATALYGLKAANGVVVITTKNGITNPQANPEELAILAKVKARKNFNETAFFLPTLRTNSKGEVRFTFTMPEALTTWKLQLLAHSKDLKIASKTLSTVTQKDLMIVTNTPRFLREGDSIIIQSKISNLTNKAGNGFAQLVLSNALDGKSLDKILGNLNTTKHFEVKSKGNTAVSWKLFIPKGTPAVQWKVVAKMGQFTDGEQNALPVLSNRILVTETMAMQVRQGETKQFNLAKLSANKSNTLSNHRLTLEITSNPAWYAVQSLPYLMEFPHECAEQTFSRYYANALATHIANSNPKIQEIFKQWENTDALLSNLEKNQELKSLIIQETPWLRDAQSEAAQKKRIGLLFDLNKMSRELKRATNKLANIQKSNGGFPWFKGGRYASSYITRHIASGYGHLKHLGVTNYSPKTTKMITKAVAFLDNEFNNDYQYLLNEAHRIVLLADKKHKKQARLDSIAYLEKNNLSNNHIHYLYMRSFYKDISINNELAKAINYYTKQSVKYWQERNNYSEAMIALYLHRGENEATAKAIIASLDESSITSEEMGMYWKNNQAGYYWYQASIETQAMLIEAFSEIDKDTRKIDNLKLWLLKNKQTSRWRTTKATTEAIYALLLQGSEWLSVSENIGITIGDTKIDPNTMPDVKLEAGTGYFKKSWTSNEIEPAMGSITLSKKEKGVAWGGLYWQYFEDMDKVSTSASKTPLHLKKQVFIKKNKAHGEEISLVKEDTKLQVGDLLRIRIELRADRRMEFVHMKDMRAAGLEPINVISKYKWQDGLGYYESTKDAATHFFISNLPKGIYVFEYDLHVNNAGNFSNGITTIQSMYAPEFSSHSEGIRLKITSEK